MLLSDIDGLYDSDPRQNPDARLIHVVPELNDAVFALALKSGNVCVLRSGKESIRSAAAIVTALKEDILPLWVLTRRC